MLKNFRRSLAANLPLHETLQWESVLGQPYRVDASSYLAS